MQSCSCQQQKNFQFPITVCLLLIHLFFTPLKLYIHLINQPVSQTLCNAQNLNGTGVTEAKIEVVCNGQTNFRSGISSRLPASTYLLSIRYTAPNSPKHNILRSIARNSYRRSSCFTFLPLQLNFCVWVERKCWRKKLT